MALVDAGHHGTEKIATDIIKRHIEGHIKGTDMEIEVMKSETNTNPFILL
jgi:putative NIF3 family GTP cyclohydrolase 1 type 2